ncbi:MAG: MBL fold metallo-hydrolase [Aestuariibacter sp.]
MSAIAKADETIPLEQFCLTGEFNLGARLQGMTPEQDEFYPMTWCITTESNSGNITFYAEGKSNPDMEGSYHVKFIPPDKVQLLAENGNVELQFDGAIIANEALRHQRMNPDFLLKELEDNPDWILSSNSNNGEQIYKVRYPDNGFIHTVSVKSHRLNSVKTWADIPLRGRVPVVWQWHWNTDQATLTILLADQLLMRATASRNTLHYQPRQGIINSPHQLPGKAWPSRQAMSINTLADDVFMVTNVRTGFHHLVVKTQKGLVIADAPAGWVEVHQIPPTDLVPEQGISGLSESFIGFLKQQWPDSPIAAVILTHFHDDHAGGARAFAAHGAEVYSHATNQAFLEKAFNSPAMPSDQLSMKGEKVKVLGISQPVNIASTDNRLVAYPIPKSPHANAGLAVYVEQHQILFVSDIHVPSGDSSTPRQDKLITDCWFANWAAENFPKQTRIYNSHNMRTTPMTTLYGYRVSEACRSME